MGKRGRSAPDRRLGLVSWRLKVAGLSAALFAALFLMVIALVERLR